MTMQGTETPHGRTAAGRREARARALAALADSIVAPGGKGMPPQAGALALGDIGRQGWNLLKGDLTFPAAVLLRSAMDTNERWMRAFVESHGVSIAPHGKTTMAPQLFDLQERGGAWAITVSTVQQAAVCRAFAFDRIIIANQVIGRAEIAYLFAELRASPELELYCLVDSLEGVERLAAGGAGLGINHRLNLLVEVGHVGGRTGARSIETAVAVARAAARHGFSLRGVEGFEGFLETGDRVDAFLASLVAVAAACGAEGLFAGPGPVILSAGGTVFYDRVPPGLGAPALGREVKVVLRSGCYLTHDSHLVEDAYQAMRARAPAGTLPQGRPAAALMVWALVQSMPEPGRTIVTMGRRDVGHDSGLPVPLLWFRPGLHGRPVAMPPGHHVSGLNDQHGYLTSGGESPIMVGDMIGFGVSHPCTTFDKWALLYVVDDDYAVVDAVRTFF
mgnify:CR=1 FL=1